jgi:putative intracellular protease/amidase
VNSLKKSLKLFSLFLTLLVTCNGVYLTPATASSGALGSHKPGHKILVLAATGVGDTYFIAKNQFESWGWIVATAGLTQSVTSCPNTNPRPIGISILISEVDNNTLSQYECIFIPSGGHWQALSNDGTTLNLILNAFNMGLVISSLCVGIVVLARANIVNGVRIAYDVNSMGEVVAAGGIIVYERVVSHRRIVTGGTGGGPAGGGASEAPTIEVCEAIAELIEKKNLPLSITVVVITGLALAGIILFIKRKKRTS